MANPKRCNRCRGLIIFKQAPNRSGYLTWQSFNLDGSPHFKDCDRAQLFIRAKLHCRGCESRLQRDAGEWREGNYYELSSQELRFEVLATGERVYGRWFPCESFRLLHCPSCNWFYSWDVKNPNEALSFQDVEACISKLSDADFWRLYYRELRITKLSA